MRGLVVGGAGFLGSHLCDRLLAEGWSVDVVDDLSGGSLANLAAARATAPPHSLTFHQCAAAEPGLPGLLARRAPEVVYLLAGSGDGPEREPEALALGTVAAHRVLQAATACGAAKVVAAVAATDLYAEPATRDLPVKESHPWAARSVAAVACRSLVDLLAVHREQHALEFTVLALDLVVGARARRGPVAELLAAAASGRPVPVPGDGRGTMDLVGVDDAVDALVRAATRGSGLVVNVGTGTQTSFLDLARLAGAREVVRGAPTGRPPRFALSSVRARIHLGWVPFTPLDAAVADALAAGSPVSS